jgi:hypothetical protein
MPDKNPLYNTSGPRAITKEDKDAMNAMMKARLAYAEMHGNPAAKRMIAPTDNPYIFDDGDTGTHHMASYDKYAIPNIQDVPPLEYTGPRIDEAIKFDREEDAKYFAKNYKDISPALRNGGAMAPIIPTYYKSKGTPIYRDTTALPFREGGFVNSLRKQIKNSRKFVNGGDTEDIGKGMAYEFWKNKTQPVDKFGRSNVNYQGPTTFRSLSNQVNAPIPTKADEFTNQYGYDYKKTYDESGTPHYYTKKEGADSWIDLETERNKNQLAAVKALAWGDDTSYIGTEAHKNQIRDQLIKNEDARIKGLSSEEYTKELLNSGISYEDLNKASFEKANKEKTNTQYASVYDAITGNTKNTITTTEDNIARDKYGNPRKAVFGEPGFREQQINLNTGNPIKPVTKYKESYHKINAITSELLEKIAKSTMSNIEKRNLLQNPEKLQNLLTDYATWQSSPQGRANDAYSRRGAIKSDDFIINDDGTADFQIGANPVVIDGGVNMLDKEWITGVVGGKVAKELIGGAAGMIASKFKANPVVQATGQVLKQPLLTNTIQGTRFAPYSKYMLSPLKIADVAGGVYGVNQFRDPNSMTRQSIKDYQQGEGSLSDALFNTSMSVLSATPVGSEILRTGYGNLIGGINAVRKMPQIRDFRTGFGQVTSGEASIGDLFRTQKYSRFTKPGQTGSSKDLVWFKNAKSNMEPYKIGADKVFDLKMTNARASLYNAKNIQNRINSGLTNEAYPLESLIAERSIAPFKSYSMTNYMKNTPALQNPKTLEQFKLSLNNPENYWKLPGYTDEISTLLKNAPADQNELAFSKKIFGDIKAYDASRWTPDYNLLDDLSVSYGGAKSRALRESKKVFDLLGKWSGKGSKIYKIEQAGFDLNNDE